MSNSVRIEGMDDLKKMLGRMEDSVNRRILLSALRTAAKPLVKSAKSKVPVNTGNLKKSIGTITGKNKNLPVLWVGPRYGARRKNDGWYGRFVEFGTVKMAARPFMRPAYDETKEEISGTIASEIGQSINRYFKRRAKRR